MIKKKGHFYLKFYYFIFEKNSIFCILFSYTAEIYYCETINCQHATSSFPLIVGHSNNLGVQLSEPSGNVSVTSVFPISIPKGATL